MCSCVQSLDEWHSGSPKNFGLHVPSWHKCSFGQSELSWHWAPSQCLQTPEGWPAKWAHIRPAQSWGYFTAALVAMGLFTFLAAVSGSVASLVVRLYALVLHWLVSHELWMAGASLTHVQLWAVPWCVAFWLSHKLWPAGAILTQVQLRAVWAFLALSTKPSFFLLSEHGFAGASLAHVSRRAVWRTNTRVQPQLTGAVAVPKIILDAMKLAIATFDLIIASSQIDTSWIREIRTWCTEWNF